MVRIQGGGKINQQLLPKQLSCCFLHPNKACTTTIRPNVLQLTLPSTEGGEGGGEGGENADLLLNTCNASFKLNAYCTTFKSRLTAVGKSIYVISCVEF